LNLLHAAPHKIMVLLHVGGRFFISSLTLS
jgi:hypothetical protein